MNKELFEKRKKVIYDFVCDKHYVPMKAKELAMLLQVPKDEREALAEVLDALVPIVQRLREMSPLYEEVK